MSDQELRQLENTWKKSRLEKDEHKWLSARRRSGSLSRWSIYFGAYFGHYWCQNELGFKTDTSKIEKYFLRMRKGLYLSRGGDLPVPEASFFSYIASVVVLNLFEEVVPCDPRAKERLEQIRMYFTLGRDFNLDPRWQVRYKSPRFPDPERMHFYHAPYHVEGVILSGSDQVRELRRQFALLVDATFEIFYRFYAKKPYTEYHHPLMCESFENVLISTLWRFFSLYYERDDPELVNEQILPILCPPMIEFAIYDKPLRTF